MGLSSVATLISIIHAQWHHDVHKHVWWHQLSIFTSVNVRVKLVIRQTSQSVYYSLLIYAKSEIVSIYLLRVVVLQMRKFQVICHRKLIPGSFSYNVNDKEKCSPRNIAYLHVFESLHNFTTAKRQWINICICVIHISILTWFIRKRKTAWLFWLLRKLFCRRRVQIFMPDVTKRVFMQCVTVISHNRT